VGSNPRTATKESHVRAADQQKEKSHLVETLTLTDAQRLRDAVPKTPRKGTRNVAIILLMFATGMRSGNC
jgi:site-specific recombinase XerD